MNFMEIYRSKRFLFRMLLSFTLLVMACLVFISGILYYYFQRDQLRMQYEANEKVLNQVDKNIYYLDLMVKTLASSVFLDQDLLSLTYGTAMEDIVTKTRQLNKIHNNSPFLHSIVFYNPKLDRLFANTSGSVDNEEMFAQLRRYMKDRDSFPKMSLTPFYYGGRADASVRDSPDFFTYIMYESLDQYTPGDSILFLNVKSDWVLDNVKLPNSPDNKVFVMDPTGKVILQDPDSARQYEIVQRVKPRLFGGGKQGYFLLTEKGDRSIITYFDVSEIAWKVVMVQPVETILFGDDNIRWITLAITLIFVLLSVFVSVFISRRLYRPVERLIRQIDFAPGKPELENAVKPEDELGYISSYQRYLAERLLSMDKDKLETQPIMRNYYLRRLIVDSHSLNREETEQIGAALSLDLQGRFVVGVFKIDQLDRFKERNGIQEQRLIRFAILNIARDIVTRKYECETLDMRSDHLALLVSVPGADDLPRLKEMVEEIQELAADYYKTTFTAALSGLAHGCGQITEKYNEALQLSLYRLVYGRNAVITADIEPLGEPLDAAAEHERKILEGVKLNNEQLFASSLQKFKAYISQYPYDQIMSAVMHLLLTLNQTGKEIGGNMINPIGINFMDPKLFERETLDEIIDAVADLGKSFFEQRSRVRSEKNETLVYTIQEIIDERYMDPDLNVQKIAALLKMSYVYIGKIFKTAKQLSIVDYINEVRLTHVAKLLENGDMSVNEIMNAVGYGNQSYFFYMFKKKYGTSPKDYRLTRSIHRKDE